MVGVEVRRYGLEARIAELARRLAIPVVTSFMGRGLLAQADVQLAGTYIGLAGDQAVSELVEQSDGLLLMGVIVSDTNFAVSAKRIDMRSTIQVYDGNVHMGHHVYHELPIAALIDALLARVAPLERASTTRPTHHAAASQALSADASAVQPHDISASVNALFREHGPMPLASDIGDCLFTAMDIDQTTLVAPGYYATMGYGVPAGIGVQVATGLRPIVMVGDGAFQMTGWELGNAAHCGCDPIVLVLNNASWEMLRAFEPNAKFNDLARWDFASMAAGMGGDGHVVNTTADLVAALAKAHATHGRCQLLDIRIEPGVLSPTLSRFVNAVKRVSMPEQAVQASNPNTPTRTA
jgi:indolepyruvate decarboxylase